MDETAVDVMPRPVRGVDVRSLTWYIVLTFAIDWGLLAAYFGLGGEWKQPWATVIASVFMFGPAVAAVVVQRFIRGRAIRDLGVRWQPNRWWLLAWLGPVAYALATLVSGFALPDVGFDPSIDAMMQRFSDLLGPEQLEAMREQAEALPVHVFWVALGQGLIAGPTVNAVFGMGEELGWRGLMQDLLSPLGFWRMSAVTGVIWGVWHAPLILIGHNYPAHPQIGVAMMIAWTMLLSPPFAWIRMRSRSVVAAAILHGTLNATAGLPLILTAGGTDLTVGVTGAAGLAVLAVLNVVLWASRAYPGSERPAIG